MFQKRKRPSRSCTVPSGFWDPVVKTGDSGIDSHSDNEDQSGSFKEEEVIRAQRRMKNFEPAPSNHETCYTETPAVSDVMALGRFSYWRFLLGVLLITGLT